MSWPEPGPEDVAIGHVRPGTPFRYTANVHFDAHSGFGKRNEQTRLHADVHEILKRVRPRRHRPSGAPP